jgi:hypothetical protein
MGRDPRCRDADPLAELPFLREVHGRRRIAEWPVGGRAEECRHKACRAEPRRARPQGKGQRERSQLKTRPNRPPLHPDGGARPTHRARSAVGYSFARGGYPAPQPVSLLPRLAVNRVFETPPPIPAVVRLGRDPIRVCDRIGGIRGVGRGSHAVPSLTMGRHAPPALHPGARRRGLQSVAGLRDRRNSPWSRGTQSREAEL